MRWTDWEAQGLTENDLPKLKGREVYSSDNKEIGKVDRVWNPMQDVDETTLRVKTSDRQIWVPLGAITDIQKDRIVLDASQDDLKNPSWSEAPPGWVPSVDE